MRMSSPPSRIEHVQFYNQYIAGARELSIMKRMSNPSRWLIYALGGGFGHLTRACALARETRDADVRILTNSPYVDWVRAAEPGLDIVALHPAMPITEARVAVLRQIDAAAPDCLVVDT